MRPLELLHRTGVEWAEPGRQECDLRGDGFRAWRTCFDALLPSTMGRKLRQHSSGHGTNARNKRKEDTVAMDDLRLRSLRAYGDRRYSFRGHCWTPSRDDAMAMGGWGGYPRWSDRGCGWPSVCVPTHQTMDDRALSPGHFILQRGTRPGSACLHRPPGIVHG